MNLQYEPADEAADYIYHVNAELTNFEIKGALINALNRIALLEKQVQHLQRVAMKEQGE